MARVLLTSAEVTRTTPEKVAGSSAAEEGVVKITRSHHDAGTKVAGHKRAYRIIDSGAPTKMACLPKVAHIE